MGYINNWAPKTSKCVFKSVCDHAPATHTYYHEFVNHPQKYLCTEHASRINAWQNRPRKKGKH